MDNNGFYDDQERPYIIDIQCSVKKYGFPQHVLTFDATDS
jgi:hypothetical protein